MVSLPPPCCWCCLWVAYLLLFLSRSAFGFGFLWHSSPATRTRTRATSFTVLRVALPKKKVVLLAATSSSSWNDRLEQLQHYKNTYGDCLVPKRYKDNPSLGNWVNKQRQHHKKYLEGIPCSLTRERVQQLNAIGFVWNASSKNTSKQESQWQRRFQELKEYKRQHGDTNVRPSSPLGFWINAQRNEYITFVKNATSSTLTQERVALLNSLGFDWKHKRQQVWDERIQQLLEYQKKFGDTAVPVSYENRPLAHWVSNQRKQYNLKQAGKPSLLTQDRIQQLNNIGFIWNRWEYEFEKKDKNADDYRQE